jgi:hypothetical protein
MDRVVGCRNAAEIDSRKRESDPQVPDGIRIRYRERAGVVSESRNLVKATPAAVVPEFASAVAAWEQSGDFRDAARILETTAAAICS